MGLKRAELTEPKKEEGSFTEDLGFRSAGSYGCLPPEQDKALGARANLEGENVLTALPQPALSVTRPTGSVETSFLAKSR